MSIILKEMRGILNLLPKPQMPLIARADLPRATYLHWRLGWVKGCFYRLRWRVQAALGGARVSAGPRLSIQGKLRTVGNGRVVLGSDVLIDGRTDLYTHAKDAVIRVGDNVFLNGTRVSAQVEVAIGNLCILGDARIMDTDFHSTRRNRQDRTAPIHTGKVRIGNNVWVGAAVGILKGVSIGDDSVVGYGSVVNKDLPAGVLAFGNPATVVAELPSV